MLNSNTNEHTNIDCKIDIENYLKLSYEQIPDRKIMDYSC